MGEEIAGWHRLSVERDRARFRASRGEPAWDVTAGPGTEDFLQSVVVPAAREDAVVFRAVTRQAAQLDPPQALAQNTVVQQRAQALAAGRHARSERAAPGGPPREELLQVLAAAGPSTASRAAWV